MAEKDGHAQVKLDLLGKNRSVTEFLIVLALSSFQLPAFSFYYFAPISCHCCSRWSARWGFLVDTYNLVSKPIHTQGAQEMIVHVRKIGQPPKWHVVDGSQNDFPSPLRRAGSAFDTPEYMDDTVSSLPTIKCPKISTKHN